MKRTTGTLRPRPRVADRWIRNASDERAVHAGCTFDERAALRPVFFFEKFLRHSKGQWAGQPFTLLDWQRDEIIMPLFGWMRPDGTRRFREGAIFVPKKNGKSTLGAGLELYMLEADGEPGADCYGAAADREQAGIVYREAAEMTKTSPHLSERTTLVESRKRIVAPLSGSFYQVLSADAFRAEGINAHFVLFDELHTQRWRILYEALKYAGAARRQPLFLSISTAGEEFDTSLCGEVWAYSEQVLAGAVHDTAFFAYIRAAAKTDDWKSPRTWAKANPSYGITIQEEDMRRAAEEAQAKPALLSAFLRYRLNIWPEGVVAAWLDLQHWDACAGGRAVEDPELESLVGEPCFAGVDLSSVADLTALALWFPLQRVLKVWAWCPEDNIRERARLDRVPYDAWARQGHLLATPGNRVDYLQVWSRIEDCARRFRLVSLRIDRWNATATENHLQERGIPVREFGQGFATMSPAAKEFERRVLGREFRHDGNPVLRWCVGNVVVQTDDAGNIKPTKRKSREKIDAAVAAIMAMAEPDEEERNALVPAAPEIIQL